MLTVSAGALADMVGTSDGILLDFWVYSDFTQDVSWKVMKGWAEDFIANDADVTGINAATARWLKYMGTKEAGAEWAVKLGRPVLREDSMADEAVTSTMIGAVSAVGLQGGMRQMDFGKTNVFWPSALGDIRPQVSSGAMTAEEGAEAMIEAINDMIADEDE